MIVVTTPTGGIGRQVLAGLLDAGEPVRVIARDPARLPAGTRERVEVVQGSQDDPGVVARAFAGAEAVFWLPPPSHTAPSMEAVFTDFTRPAAEAFARAGVARVVGVSGLGRGVPGPAGQVTASLAMDDLIAASGVAYRALAMPSFMDNWLRQVGSIRDRGVIVSTMPPGLKVPTCAVRDIAAAAVRLLRDRGWSGTGHLGVLGPEDLSHDDLARIMGEVLGKAIRYQQVPMEAFQANLLAGGFSPAAAQAFVEMMTAKANGLDNAEPRTAENTTPTSFRQWCEEVLKPAVAA